MLMLSILFALFFSRGYIILSISLGSYLAANLIASLIIGIQRGWSNLPLLPITFATLHISYGLGFRAELFHFWNRWNDKVSNSL